MPDKSIHVVFPLFDGLAALDFVAPHAAFSVVPDARITVASVGGRNIDANGLVFSKLADLSKVEGCDVFVRVDKRSHHREGESVAFDLVPQRLHLFDKASGASLLEGSA